MSILHKLLFVEMVKRVRMPQNGVLPATFESVPFVQMLPEQKIKMVTLSVHYRHLEQLAYFVVCHQVIGPIEHDEYGIIIVFAHGVIHCLSQYLVLSILRWRRVLGMAMLHRIEHRDCVTWKWWIGMDLSE